jgi:hypothetical protein
MDDAAVRCLQMEHVAIAVQDFNPCDGTYERAAEALEVVECCRRRGRDDLAEMLMQKMEEHPNALAEPFLTSIAKQRKLIDVGDRSPAIPQALLTGPSAEPVPQDLPPITVRGLNFAGAVFRAAQQGFPRRTQDEINDRLAICQACEHLVDNHCVLCGCACVEANQVMNKLAWKTEKCPIGRWE